MARDSRKNNVKNGLYRRLERRRQVAELYLGGKTQTDIALIVGVTQATVSTDLGVIKQQWLERTQAA